MSVPKISVLHIITRLIVGGAQENTLYTAALLDKNSFYVDVLTGPQTGPEGSLIEDAYSRKLRLIIENNLVREIRPIKDLSAFIRLFLFMRRNKYTIVHTHSSKAGILGRWAAWLAGVPIIIHTVHGWGFHDYQNAWLKKSYILAERLTLLITDKLIAVAKKDIEKGVSAGIGSKSDYALIRSGIELDFYRNSKKTSKQVRCELGIPEHAKVIGTVTRLSPQKSPLTFVKTAISVIKRIPDAYFVMVGDGPLRHQIEDTLQKADIADHVILTGVRRDVPELLHSFDLFLLTSLWEGLPRVIPQAMAAGVPVIASKVDGSAEIIKHNVNGLLVEPNDVESISDEITELLNSPHSTPRLNALKANAFKGLDDYSVFSMVDKITNLYQSFQV